MCRVTFLTSVYNCEQYIGETIQSVIDQTFRDWEYIVIDDCSGDHSAEIIKGFRDPRIRFIQNKKNQGQCANLNYGISLAEGEFIARLDHDDICYPNRIERQIQYMDSHPSVALVGSNADLWENGRIKLVTPDELNNPREVAFSLWFNQFFSHSSFFIRNGILQENGIGYGDYLYAEDYDLAVRMLAVGEVGYIKESLLAYRVFPEQYTKVYGKELKDKEAFSIRNNYMEIQGIQQLSFLRKAGRYSLKTAEDFEGFHKDFIELADHFGIKTHDEGNECLKLLLRTAMIYQYCNYNTLRAYYSSPFRDKEWLKSKRGIMFIGKCLLNYNRR